MKISRLTTALLLAGLVSLAACNREATDAQSTAAADEATRTVGTEVSLQTHLFEDRVMKMSAVTVKAGATIGTRAIVLYDTVVGDGVSLGPLSLLMKGEQLTPGTRWHGIPAQGVNA